MLANFDAAMRNRNRPKKSDKTCGICGIYAHNDMARDIDPEGLVVAGDQVAVMSFDVKTVEMVRRAFTESRHDLLFTMIPTDDGGQSYEMKCRICGGLGNILSSKFVHAQDCPVGTEGKKSFVRE